MTDLPDVRAASLLRECIHNFSLDLRGLTVFTEAATGHYMYTPIMAAMAGARRVYALAKGSPYGTKESVLRMTAEAADRLGVASRVTLLEEKTPEAVSESDIVTNTGAVRPIGRDMISLMKPTAVIPLMWETWEFREQDLDLKACREKGIPVLGTDESMPPLRMYPYSGFLAMKLLFEMGLEGYKTNVILLGGGSAMGRSIYEHFTRLGMEVAWFSRDDSMPYRSLKGFYRDNGARYDAIIAAELQSGSRLIGEGGYLSYDDILKANPATRIGVIAGDIDAVGLKRSGLAHYPGNIRPFGYMSYQSFDLGPRPVFELYAAGLKVGEAMARARLAGMSPEAAKAHAFARSAAMDFKAVPS